MLLSRFGSSPMGTFGELIGDDFHCYTVEREWIPSQSHPAGTPGKSCVPAGVYVLEPHHSKRFGETYALVNTEIGVYHYHYSNLSRWGILFHAANLSEQLEGCIATGRELTAMTSSKDGKMKWAVNTSKVTHNKLMKYIDQEGIETLTIEWKNNDNNKSSHSV